MEQRGKKGDVVVLAHIGARASPTRARGADAPFDVRDAMASQIKAALAACVAEHLDEKSVHECRVHLKRARALARVGQFAAPGLFDVFNDVARDVMHALSAARDLAALAKAARDLAASSGPHRRQALLACAKTLDRERADLAPIETDKVRASLRDLIALTKVWPDVTDAHVRQGAAKIARRARKAYRQGYRAKRAELRHAWRKREKDRLYVVDLLSAHWPKDLAKRRASSRALAECLGKEREVLLLIEKLNANPALAGNAKATARALKASAKSGRHLRKTARKLGAKLHRAGA
jgi:hypothetical protein